MKLTILPQKKEKNTVVDSTSYLKVDMDSNSKYASFLQKNLILILSFVIPVFVLGLFLNLFGFAPFGEKCFFVSDGLNKNLQLLSQVQHYIKTHTFPLVTSADQSVESYLYVFFHYFTSPFRMICLVMSFKAAVCYLQILTVLEIGLSGTFFAYYLTHRYKGFRYPSDDFSVLLFSLAYALSGYMLVQYNDFLFLEIAMLFPLFFLQFEKMLATKNARPFRICLALCILSQYYLAVILVLFLFVYLLFIKYENQNSVFQNIITYLSNSFIALCYGAITLIPGMYLFYKFHILPSHMPDFSLNVGLFSFFSRFLPMNYASHFNRSLWYGSNLYCGLFVLFLLPIFFFQKKKSFAEKLRVFLFLLFLFCSVNLHQIQYVFRLSSVTTSAFNCYAFLFVFFVLQLAADCLYSYKDTPFFLSLLAFFIPAGLYFAACQYAKDYSRASSITTVLILLTLYLIYLVLYLIKSITPVTFYALLLLTSMLELSLNAYSNLMDTNMIANTIEECEKAIDVDIFAQTQQPEALAYLDISMPFFFQMDSYDLEHISSAGNIFEKQNTLFSLYQPDTDLFTNANIKIACKQTPSGHVCKIYQNNIVNLYKLPTDDEVQKGRDLNTLTPNTDNTSTDENQTTQSMLTLSITPDQTGDLYLYFNQLIHIGQVTKGETFDYQISFQSTSAYHVNYWIYGAYLNPSVKGICNASSQNAQSQVLEKEASFLRLSTTQIANKDCTLVSNLPYSKFIKAYLDHTPIPTTKSICATTAVSLPKGTHTVQFRLFFFPFFWGCFLSIGSILLAFCCMKKAPNSKIQNLKELCKFGLHKIGSFHVQHRYAYYAFLIPLGILLTNLIFTSCAPFGGNSWMNNDGFSLTMATYRLRRNAMVNGTLLFSWIAGGATNLYTALPNAFLDLWITLIPDKLLLPTLSIAEALRIAACGLAMYLYLTKRENGAKFEKNDFCVLLFSSAYSLSAYAVNTHAYFNWATILLLLPLLLLAFEQLILHKKWKLYTLLLAVSICFDYYLSLFVCVFLVMWFFTFHYSGIKDFLQKGIRFAVCSIFAACMSFWQLYAYLAFRPIGAYADNDNLRPTWEFFQNYWDTFKQFFIFSEPIIITNNNGAINLYCGMFVLVLSILSITLITKHRKNIYKLFLLFFLFLSSNNNLLSYIWNGFHYQTKVPNRYAFLIVFLLIDLSVEAFSHLEEFSKLRLLIASILSIGFTGAIALFAVHKPSHFSIYASITAAILFLLLLWLMQLMPHKQKLLQMCFTTLALLELTINSFAYFPDEGIGKDLMNYTLPACEYLADTYENGSPTQRANFMAPNSVNVGMLSNTPTLYQFNSFLTKYQFNTGIYLGAVRSANVINSVNNLNPVGNMFGSIPYSILDLYTKSDYMILDYSTPIDSYDHSILLRNSYALPLGYYLPKELPENITQVSNCDTFANLLSILTGVEKQIYSDQRFFIGSTTAPDEDSYLLAEAKSLDQAGDYNLYNCHLHFVPNTDGHYFFGCGEYYDLGHLKANTAYDYDFEAPDGMGYITQFHEDVLKELYDKISPYSLQDIVQTATGLSGSITLPKDGIIQFSIPYEPGWKAYLDGKEVPVKALNDSFLYVDATKGEHTISLKFFPTSFYTGIGITAFMWILFLVLVFLLKEKKRNVPNISE